MLRLNRKKLSRPHKIKFIVKESFSGTKRSKDIFADLFISEYDSNNRKIWTTVQEIDIIQSTDNSQI